MKFSLHRGRPSLAAITLVTALAITSCGGGAQSTEATAPSASQHHHSGANVPPEPLRKGERFIDLKMAAPYTPTPPNGGTDEYRCLLVDPGLTEPVYLTGAQFQAQNVPIAHHAVVFGVAPENAEVARAKDAETPGQGWTCFGADGLNTDPPSTWIDTWTPGVKETLLDQDAGFPLEPGSLLILQVHYNLLASNGKPGETDQSSIRLRVTNGTPQTKPLDTSLVVGPVELPCTSEESGPLCDRDAALTDVEKRFGGEAVEMVNMMTQRCGGEVEPGDTQQCDTDVRAPMTVYAGRGHMHKLGKSMKVELNPGTPEAKVLLDVPQFNFDNQALEVLPQPVELQAGDKLRITCTHDASLRKKLPELENLPPRYVVYADGTTDEMCLGIMTTSAVRSR